MPFLVKAWWVLLVLLFNVVGFGDLLDLAGEAAGPARRAPA